MVYHVIYDGNCNLCSNLVQLLEQLDAGQTFDYIPMQDRAALQQLNISSTDCELGMILVDGEALDRRWQGTAAAEEIGRMLPLGAIFVTAYRSLPGVKWMGDRTYEQVRDHRYELFGRRESTYQPRYPAAICTNHQCRV